MSYRNKTYVAFDGDNDIHYYRLMLAWKQKDGMAFSFYNAHDLNSSYDSSMEQSIKNQLRERILNSKIFVLLVGERTRYLTKFVLWEIEQALSLKLPIICVNLNGLREMDNDRCPPTLKDKLAVHISFNAAIMQNALENWPNSHDAYKNSSDKISPYFYKKEVYDRLGL